MQSGAALWLAFGITKELDRTTLSEIDGKEPGAEVKRSNMGDND